MGSTIQENSDKILIVADKRSRFSVAFLASVLVHLLLVWMITANIAQPPISKKKTPPIMDVVLLDESQVSNTEPENDAKTIANKNSKGNMPNAQDSRTRAARSPSTGQQNQPKKPQPLSPERPKTPPIPKQTQKKNARIISREDDNSPSLLPPEQAPEEEKKTAAKPVPNIPFANLLPPSAALTQLSREYDRERRMKQMMSKEADIGINTREAKYAPYAQGLVRALEEQWKPAGDNLGQLTQDDRRVLMRVSIENNGELGDIRIIQASPSRELNDSAVSAVHASAPFKPLPSSWGLERANFYFVFEVVEDRFVFRTL